MSLHSKLPRAFVIEGDKARPFEHTKTRTKSHDVEFSKEPDSEVPSVVPHVYSGTKSPGFRWIAILMSALSALFMLACGLWLTDLIQAYFEKSAILGWMTASFAMLAAFAAAALIIREAWGLLRLRKIESIQDAIARAVNMKDQVACQEAISGFTGLFSGRLDTANALREFATQQTEFMDAADRIMLADRILLQPLDTRAQHIISRQAKRVTLLTTVTPAAGLDILFVFALNMTMLREISTLYGGRPSSLATMKLARMIVTHLAVAGGLALSDTLIQQLVGRGLLGRLSSRFGEGAINGILTARVGLAAKAVCRPIPVDTSTRDDFVGILKKIVKAGEGEDQDAQG